MKLNSAARTCSSASRGFDVAQFFKCARHTLAARVFRSAYTRSDLAEAIPFKESQHEHLPIQVPQRGNGFIENRQDVGIDLWEGLPKPNFVGVAVHGTVSGVFLAQHATRLASGDLVEPCGKATPGFERGRLFRELHKDMLHRLLGDRGVLRSAKGGATDESRVAIHQLGKRTLIVLPREATQQLAVGTLFARIGDIAFPIVSWPQAETGHKNLEIPSTTRIPVF